MSLLQRIRDGELIQSRQRSRGMSRRTFWTGLTALAFYIHQNNYFGWHAKPQSDMELLADGLTLLLVAMVCMTLHSPNDGGGQHE